jgi:hypothetical protein
MALRRQGPVHCVTVSDERAMLAALNFSGEHVWPSSWSMLIIASQTIIV